MVRLVEVRFGNDEELVIADAEVLLIEYSQKFFPNFHQTAILNTESEIIELPKTKIAVSGSYTFYLGRSTRFQSENKLN